jgi:uncharacterized DUF497 family protein
LTFAYTIAYLSATMTLQANGFDWDKGSQRERRFRGLSRTDNGRGVFIVFTLRRKGDELLIRPISARSMHKKEIDAYEKENSNL